ncbi:MAG: hypothetical protein PWQ12_2126, partial [Clostridiales bacterium]|nr:hypothetical protein [Clostridiales bacterium]
RMYERGVMNAAKGMDFGAYTHRDDE